MRLFQLIPSGEVSIVPLRPTATFIETPEQSNALTLFREASATNNDYLAFIFFWQILEMGTGHGSVWVNATFKTRRNRLMLSDHDLRQLPLNHRNLGEYFYEDCRNAIAHICKRRPGLSIVQIDELQDNTRITVSKRVVKEFARVFIEDELKLMKEMFLQKKLGGFPLFVSEDESKEREWWGAKLQDK